MKARKLYRASRDAFALRGPTVALSNSWQQQKQEIYVIILPQIIICMYFKFSKCYDIKFRQFSKYLSLQNYIHIFA